MPVPASINDLSTIPGNNSPAGSESPTLTDNYLRTLSAFIASLRDSGAVIDGIAVKKDSSASTGAAILPPGTTAQRPASPQNGMFRYNTDISDFEGYMGGAWVDRRTFTRAINEPPIVTLASASTTNIGAAGANTISVSGSVTITAFDSVASGIIRRLVFQGALTLTHNAASLILPSSASITTAAGDVAEFVSLGSGNWRCTGYTRSSGHPVVTIFSREFTSGQETLTPGGLITINHTLGVVPKFIACELHAVAANNGYSVGDIIDAPQISMGTSGNDGISVRRNSTQINIRQGASGGIPILNATTGVLFRASSSDWRLVAKAWG